MSPARCPWRWLLALLSGELPRSYLLDLAATPTSRARARTREAAVHIRTLLHVSLAGDTLHYPGSRDRARDQAREFGGNPFVTSADDTASRRRTNKSKSVVVSDPSTG